MRRDIVSIHVFACQHFHHPLNVSPTPGEDSLVSSIPPRPVVFPYVSICEPGGPQPPTANRPTALPLPLCSCRKALSPSHPHQCCCGGPWGLPPPASNALPVHGSSVSPAAAGVAARRGVRGRFRRRVIRLGCRGPPLLGFLIPKNIFSFCY